MGKRRRINYETGYLHVTNRGVGKHIIFEDEMDYKVFVHRLHLMSVKHQVDICAYCLMDNHFHLLIHYSDGADVPMFMHDLCGKYAIYFNRKYDRTGHLFQNSYDSRVITDEAYFLTCFRYIIRNPEKAGICKTEEYHWHSLYDANGINKFCDIRLALALCGGVSKLRDFILTENDDECFDYNDDDECGFTDERAIEYIKSRYNIESLDYIGAMEKEARNKIIVDMIGNGMTQRQIQRLTGISRTTIRMICDVD